MRKIYAFVIVFLLSLPAIAQTCSVAVTKSDITCGGLCNGTATAVMTNSKSFSWNTKPVQTKASIKNLCAGTYIVTATDNDGCIRVDSVTITEPPLIVLTGGSTNTICGQSTGTAFMSVTGGVTPFTFSWNTNPTQTNDTATALAAGNYKGKVTDATGCSKTYTATVNNENGPVLTASSTNITCNGTDDGTATVSVTGGVSPYTYSWNTNPVQTTKSISKLPAGDYTVTVTDNAGCVVTASVTVSLSTPLVLTTTQVDITGCKGQLGSANVKVTGGSSPYTYSWNTSPVQTGATAKRLSVGSYTVTVKDVSGCEATKTVTITQPNGLSLTSTTVDSKCSQSTGEASVTATGGSPGYTYSWDTKPAQKTAKATGLAAGVYAATVTDNAGCSATLNVVINNSNGPVLTTSSANIICFGAKTGTASVAVAGGVAPYTYSWNTKPVQTTASISGLVAGTYNVLVTDSAKCTAAASVTITEPKVLGTVKTQKNISCNGLSDGSASIAVSGGAAPYTYSWNTIPVDTTTSLTNLKAGNYSVTVQDANGCQRTVTFKISQPAVIAATFAVTSSACGQATGGAIVTATGGTAPYTYSWNTTPVQTNDTISDLSAGAYTVTITDANGCTQKATANVSNTNGPVLTTSVTNLSCSGTNDGTAIVAATGGTAPYTYSWNTTPAQASATATNLPAGTYTVTVTDDASCKTLAKVTVQPALSDTIVAKNITTCNGSNSGSATVTATGGTAPYTYSWNTTPVQTGAKANKLIAGTYTVIVTDSLGCSITKSITITQPAAIVLTTTTVNSSCTQSTGKATATASGGLAPYTYSWNTNPVQTTTTATGLAPGAYTVTATDANKCTQTTTVNIGTVNGPVVTVTSTNALCNGAAGTATAAVTGGKTPYTYSWNSNPVQITATASNLIAGTYNVTVTDSVGCKGSATATITQPTAIKAAKNTSNVTCNGLKDGVASVTVTGGTTPYTYSWNTNPVQTNDTIKDLVAGTYIVTVTDAKGCVITSSLKVNQPRSIAATFAVTSSDCTQATGQAIVTVTGGSAPYMYSWNTTPVQTNDTVTNLSAGAYSVTITDANGCIQKETVTISNTNGPVLTTSVTNISCSGTNDGTATVSATGGTAPYTYSWNTNPVQTRATATNLPAGDYTITVTDNATCKTLAEITVQPALSDTIVAKNITTCNGSNSGSATVTVTGGTAPYTYSWNTTPVQTGAKANKLTAGTYTVIVTDSLGCSITKSITITQPAAIVLTTTTVNSSCTQSTGQATVAASGGATPYTYLWNTNPVQTTTTATGLAPGVYTITATDGNKCTQTDTVIIGTVNGPVVTASSTNVSCNGSTSGTATAAVTGGKAPYTYSWNTNPVQTNDTISNLAAGTYTVTVTDSVGCKGSATATITQPIAMKVTRSISNVTCNGESDGKASVTVTGGTTPYTYLWNTIPLQTNDSIKNLIAGTYIATITDAKGCVITSTLKVTQPAVLATTFAVTGSACTQATGQAIVTVTGGTTPYAYAWDTNPVQTNDTATSLSAGAYSVTITDANGCTHKGKVTISNTDGPALKIAVTHVSCSGTNDGTATVTATGATPYTYSWNTTPVQTTATASNLVAGDYTVTVTDNASCSSLANVTIQPALSDTIISKNVNSCNAGNNGNATVTAIGGTAPYTYSWNTTPVQTTARAGKLSAGTYTVIVTDSLGCSIKDSVTITQPSTIVLSTSIVNSSCTQSNGQATATASGGVAPYTYSWNTQPVQTTATATGLAPGAYTVTATDGNKCTQTATVNMGTLNGPVVTASSTNVNCNGAATGTATASVTGGKTPYTYSWNSNPVQTTVVASGLAAGTYSVTVTDSIGCNGSATTTITQPTAIKAARNILNVTCNGAANGATSVTVTGGTTPYTYSWNTTPVQTTDSIKNLIAGTYLVTVTDAKACTNTFTLKVTQPAAMIVSTTTVSTACGQATGKATANPAGGAAPYTFSWDTSPVQTTKTATDLNAGTYTVTVTDASGCSKTGIANVSNANGPVVTASTTNVSCSATNDGTATASATGGTGPLTYSWNTTPVETTIKITGLTEGTYVVTVTDSLGCKGIASAVVKPAIDVTGKQTNVTCYNGNNGTAGAIVTGGTAPFTYSWNTNPVQTTATATSLKAGTYTAMVTDASSCKDSVTITITEAPEIILLTSSTGTGCGQATGSVSVASGGGVAPYTYSWNTTPATTTATVSGLAAGAYVVTVTDASSCIQTATADVTNTTGTALTTASTKVSCNGGADGTAGVTVSGGVAPLTYSWNTLPVQTGDTAIGLTAGTYSVTVTDVNGCKGVSSIDVVEPDAITVNINQANTSCPGGTNGSIDASATGGTGSYTYSWNTTPVQTTSSIANLIAGTYTVTITDSLSCVKNAPVTIAEPGVITLVATVTNAMCNGGNDGSINITSVSGGTPGYSYSWNTTPVQSQANAVNLEAGSYDVTIKDTLGCLKTIPFTVTEPAAITFTSSQKEVTCNGGNNGEATVTAAGGASPYTYSWNTNPVQTTATASGLTAGTYIVTAKDTIGCSATKSITITEAPLLVLTPSAVDASCGANAGQVSVAVAGGTPVYTYSWNTTPVKTTVSVSGLAAGAYIVTVTDSNNCTQTATANVANSDGPVLTTAKKEVSCNGYADGMASVLVTNGTAPYTYSWNTNPVTTGEDTIRNLEAGTYTVSILDNAGCTGNATVVIKEPAPVNVNVTTTDVSCNGGTDGSLAAVVKSGGTPGYKYSWNTTPAQLTATATNLSAGMYLLTITDTIGCTDTSSYKITAPAAMSIALTPVNLKCNGDNNGSITADVSGGNMPYTYSWNTAPVQTTANASGLKAGTYTLTVTDANVCTAVKTVAITEPALLSTSFTHTDVLCNGGSTGDATVIVSGGTQAYTYEWNTVPVQKNATATGLGAGTYSVAITDANNCQWQDSVEIIMPDALKGTISKIDPVCNNGSDGSIDIAVDGGTLPYTYSWNTTPLQTTATASGLNAGTYTVTMKDANLCTLTKTVTLSEPSALVVTTVKTNVTVNGSNDGTATASATGGTPGYSYSWSTSPAQTTATAANLVAGDYTVTVTDSTGCTATKTVTITEPLIFEASVVSIDVSCNGLSDGEATVTTSGGVPVYSYSWNTIPVQTTAKATGLAAGIYTVTVKDGSGATVTADVNIVEPDPVSTSITQTDAICYGGSDGTATVTVSGGASVYTYKWSTTPVQKNATATGLLSGTYTVLVTDGNNCEVKDSVVILSPDSLSGTISQTGPSCNAGADGSISIAVDGGNAPYTYAWNTTPVQSDFTAIGLKAGTYSVEVTDVDGCQLKRSFALTEPSTVGVSTVHKNVLIHGENTGSATATASGGTPGFEYSWSTTPVETTAGITNLIAGSYTVTATDNAGCTATQTITITEPAVLTDTITKKDVSCSGVSDGQATASASGGIPPYRYFWDTNPVQTTATITGLYLGTYSITILDSAGAIATSSITINPPLVADITGKTAMCLGDTVELTATTGTSYSWSTGATTASIKVSPATATVYRVKILNGTCLDSAEVEVVIDKIPVAAIAGTTTLCGGLSTTLTASGGTNYLWSTNDTTAAITFTPDATDTYSVKVSNGCSFSKDSVIVIVNPTPVVNAGQDTTIYQGLSVQLMTPAGQGTYAWTPSLGLSCTDCFAPLAKPTESTTYYLTVTSPEGCMAGDTVVITIDKSNIIYVPNIFSPNGDGENDLLFVRGKGIKSVQMFVYNRWGQKVFETTDMTKGWDGTMNGEILETSLYVYYLDVLFYNGTKVNQKGDVTLLR